MNDGVPGCLLVQRALLALAGAFAVSVLVLPVNAVAQAKASLKVDDVRRTRLLDMVDHKLEPRGADQILLILRIEGISLEEFQKVPEDHVVLLVGEGRYTPAFQKTAAAQTSYKDGKPVKTISPLIVIVFSVPRDAMTMKLTVGDRPPIAFKPTGGISDRLSIYDL